MIAPRLSIQNAHHSYFGVPVNKNISFQVVPGEILGLVGENGAGKSTLMNVLGGVIKPDSGVFLLDGESYEPQNTADAKRRGINFVHQELNLFSELSVVDNLFITGFPKRFGIFTAKKRALEVATAILESVGLDVSPSTQVGSMSPGQRQLLEFAKGIMGEPRVVILDEPTTSLTQRETTLMFERIKELASRGTSFIFVSHILEDVIELCDRIAVMRDGELVNLTPASDISVGKLIESMVGKKLSKTENRRKSGGSSIPIVRTENLSVEGQFTEVTFSVQQGEIVGLFGLMGSGRTELAMTVFGVTKPNKGRVFLEESDITHSSTRERIRKGIAMVTEDRRGDGLLMPFPVVPNAILAAFGLASRGRKRIRSAKEQLDATQEATSKLNLKASDLTQTPVEFLSGGNQQKVVLSKWDIANPRFLILDEPTRGIDVGARMEVYQAIKDRSDGGAAQLVISSELDELINLVDRILVMRHGRLVAEFTSERFTERDILGAAFGEEAHATRGDGS